jgi:PHD/YefM family antitoxin component YafN of YafNO toxin-antitoxin module
MKDMGDVIILSKEEYNDLMEKIYWLECLEAAGVDNWSGMEEAIRIRNEEE